jgi:polyhydroxyalkanoate synthesis regulator phasin
VSLKVCIPGMVERGEITPEQAKQMEEIYDQIEAQYRPQMSESAAAAKASQETVDQLAAEVFQRKRQAVMQIAAQRSALDNMASYPGSKGAAAMALLDGDGKATYSNVEGRRKAILGRSHAMMEGVLARHRRRVYGVVRDRAGLRNLVREAFGEDTGSIAAKELADAWAQTAEMLRKRFNAAGGAIGKLDKWGMPQVHNSVAVRKAGFQAWNDFIAPRLDLSKMADDVSGAPLTHRACAPRFRMCSTRSAPTDGSTASRASSRDRARLPTAAPIAASWCSRMRIVGWNIRSSSEHRRLSMQ